MLTILLIAIGLSMDAFSLAIGYGSLGMKKKQLILVTIIVGLFHFFMPIIGNCVGKGLVDIFGMDPNVIAGTIFLIISAQMLYSVKKEEKVAGLTSLITIILFGFSVSIDSFSVGIGLTAFHKNMLLCSTIFSIVSASFTMAGLFLGKYLNKKIGKYATLIGGLLLLIMSIYCFI